MRCFFSQKFRIFITVSVLTIGVFSFFHSEFGLLNYDNDNHGRHDYCEIIKETKTQVKNVRDLQPVFTVIEVLQHYRSNSEETILFELSLSSSTEHFILKNSSESYLFNKIFLI